MLYAVGCHEFGTNFESTEHKLLSCNIVPIADISLCDHKDKYLFLFLNK